MSKEDHSHPHEAYRKLVPSLAYMERIASSYWTGEVELEAIKIKIPANESVETLIVLTGVDHAGTPVVAFHSALGPIHALAGALRRMGTGQLKWKVDEFRKGA